MNRPAIFGEQLPSALEPSVRIPVLSLQDQATGSGRATGILDGSRILTRKHQWFIDTCRKIGEGIRNRVRLDSQFGFNLNGGRDGKGVDCDDCASD